MTRTEIIAYCSAKLGISSAAVTTQGGTFLDARWQMIWNAAPWRQTRYQETIAVASGTQDVTVGVNCELVRACRWAENYELLPISDEAALAINAPGYDASGPVLGFTPLGKTADQVVIRLQQKPNESKNLLVIGKRKVLALAGGDTPPIPGADMCLCELVMGDLYEWLRQNSTADRYFQKGLGLLEQMKQIEVEQTGAISRIIPSVQMQEQNGIADSMRPLG